MAMPPFPALLSRRAPRLLAAAHGPRASRAPTSASPLPVPFFSRSAVTIKRSTGERARRVPRPSSSASAPLSRAAEASGTGESVRLAKRIAMSGLCSRREAEKRILQRQVTVNGRVVDDVGANVRVAEDAVAVAGRPLAGRPAGRAARPEVFMAHKLAGELVTASDPQGRATIFDRLRVMGLAQHLMPVGRLDFNTEGLLLLTTDGDYARQLEHPSSEVPRVYRALVRGNVSESKLLELRRGPTVDGVKYRPIHASVQSTDKKDSWLQVRITEGKNREVRKALAHVRLVVKRLVRVQFGPYRLADLPPGSVLAVRAKPLDRKPAVRTRKPADK